MAEPSTSTTGIVAAATVLLGSAVAGEYAVIVLAALAGSLWALSSAETATRAQGAGLVLRMVLTATVLAGSFAWWAESQLELPSTHLVAPAAFVIAAVGNRWRAVLDALGERLRRLAGRDGSREGGKGDTP